VFQNWEAVAAEADLGMFSMFGEQGPPQKGTPTRGSANFDDRKKVVSSEENK